MQHIQRYICTLALFSAGVCANQEELPTGFVNCGNTTYQESASLEWLDVTITQGRSYSDVLADINDAERQWLDFFSKDENWRYATKEEFKNLIFDWFGVGFNHYHAVGFPFGNFDERSVELFIYTFGDTYARFLAAEEHPLSISLDGAGAVKGLLGSYKGVTNWEHHIGFVNDSEMVYRNSQSNYRDVTDYATYAGVQADINKSDNVGSFLVREKFTACLYE